MLLYSVNYKRWYNDVVLSDREISYSCISNVYVFSTAETNLKFLLLPSDLVPSISKTRNGI